MSDIILYDIPTRGTPTCWSLNPWKARASLNYKGLAYTTDWTEYPDIAPKFKGFGIPPNGADAKFEYSSPTAKLPDGTYIMDSRKIAEALEKLQPEPSLHMDRGDVIDRAQAAVSDAMDSLRPVIMVRVPSHLLSERSAAYFSETRKKAFGMSLEELAVSEKAKTAWVDAQATFAAIGEILRENDAGPFVLGREVSFADFVIAGFFMFLKKVDERGVYERALGLDGSLRGHVEACGRWLERND